MAATSRATADPLRLLEKISKDVAIYDPTPRVAATSPEGDDLPFHEVPKCFLQWTDEGFLDLSRWSLLVSDATLHLVAEFVVAQKKSPPPSPTNMSKKAGAGAAGAGGATSSASSPRAGTTSTTTASNLNLKKSRGPLRCLNISKSLGLTDAGFCALLQVCFTLERLFVGKAPSVLTDAALAAIAISCPNLQVLNMKGSNCKMISEKLAAAVGEKCCLLTEICLSACKNVQKSVLLKLVGPCQKLEALEMASLRLVVDDDVLRMVAKRCPQLRKLDLTDCEQVSDTGILALSHGCQSLEGLALGRGGGGGLSAAAPAFINKITDVSLLALGERCLALQDLVLSNCSQLTDGGLHWLSEGCKQLKKLDLENCPKITNAGIRTLAEVCHQLTWLNLKGNRLVSDVGVRHLAQGCKGLIYLDLTGLYLLSDGKNRSFGVEGVQALCQGCQRIKTLHLSDCPQLVDITLRAVAGGLAHLERLVLGNNAKMNEAALTQIAIHCRFLKHLDLRNGGEAVTDKVGMALGQNCPELKTLILTNCVGIGISTMKWLGNGCPKLETLHLSGCTGINDLAILRLTESNFKPGLRHLFIEDCTSLTDVALSWLSEAFPTLVTVSLKGTRISNGALEAVKHRWPFSALYKGNAGTSSDNNNNSSSTDHQRGFFPVEDALDRIFIWEQAKSLRAIMKIQSLLRKVREKRKLVKMKGEAKEDKAAKRLQHFFVRLHAKRIQELRVAQFHRESQATVAIQCLVRRLQATQQLVRRREEHAAHLREESARAIDRIWRGALARKEAQRRRHALQQQIMAVCRLQKTFRGALARQQVKDLAWTWTKASTLIQRISRGHFARREAKTRSLEWNASASRIQRRLRQHLTAVRQYKADLRRRLLWTFWVAFYVCRLERLYLLRKKTRQEQRDLQEESAVSLQRIYRGFRAREVVHMLRWETTCRETLLATLESWAAVRIQCFRRQVVARRQVEQLRWQYRISWKEMMDEATQRPFFYHRFSGVIRWQRPKSLLEMVPHPRCSYCNQFEAALECGTCTDYFCNDCFRGVHAEHLQAASLSSTAASSQLPASHPKRFLYDHYHARIDYGEEDTSNLDPKGSSSSRGTSRSKALTGPRWPSSSPFAASSSPARTRATAAWQQQQE